MRPMTPRRARLRTGTRVVVDPGRGRVSDLAYAARVTGRTRDGAYRAVQLTPTARATRPRTTSSVW